MEVVHEILRLLFHFGRTVPRWEPVHDSAGSSVDVFWECSITVEEVTLNAEMRMRKVFEGYNDSTTRKGLLSGKDQSHRLCFSNAQGDLVCYQQAVAFAMQLSNYIPKAVSRDGDAQKFGFPPQVRELSLIACCRELDGMGFVFVLEGWDA
jgi:hypothetical protein